MTWGGDLVHQWKKLHGRRLQKAPYHQTAPTWDPSPLQVFNTLLLPVKKPGMNNYRPVQDFREVSKRVQDIHPTVPNPYNLLSTLPSE